MLGYCSINIHEIAILSEYCCELSSDNAHPELLKAGPPYLSVYKYILTNQQITSYIQVVWTTSTSAHKAC